MKQFLYPILFVLAACGSDDKKAETKDLPKEPLTVTKASAGFNAAFSVLMSDYLHLKDNFITESDTIINFYANKMRVDADSLKLEDLKADKTIITTAQSATESISSELTGLLGESTLENKRKSFASLSEQLYDLIRIVQYNQQVIYHQRCPMAFNNSGANWLSNSSDIKNPYIPKKMLTCGEVIDSLDFRPKQ